MGLATDLTGPADAPPMKPPSRRWRRAALVLGVAVAISAVTGAAAIAGRAKPPADRVGVQGAAPSFDLPRVGAPGDRVRLAEFRGRPLVVNFWASWCVPCRREMPALEAVADRLAGRVAFVGINHLDVARPAAEFQREFGVRYPSGFDPEGKVAPAYGVVGLPTTVLIDARGMILARHLGALTETALGDLIRRAFGIDSEASR